MRIRVKCGLSEIVYEENNETHTYVILGRGEDKNWNVSRKKMLESIRELCEAVACMEGNRNDPTRKES